MKSMQSCIWAFIHISPLFLSIVEMTNPYIVPGMFLPGIADVAAAAFSAELN